MAIGSSFESFLEEEGIKEDVETNAIKRLVAMQMQSNLSKLNMTRTDLANRLGTSRAAVGRLLDPNNESVTLHTLIRAANAMGKKVKLELV
jgi:DNA-binding Xre family transcriptional regulator